MSASVHAAMRTPPPTGADTPHPPRADPPGADTPPEQTAPPPGSRLRHTVNERPVRILLECILVGNLLTFLQFRVMVEPLVRTYFVHIFVAVKKMVVKKRRDNLTKNNRTCQPNFLIAKRVGGRGGAFRKVSLNQTFYGMFKATTEPLFYGHFMSKGFCYERIVNTMFLKGTIMYY